MDFSFCYEVYPEVLEQFMATMNYTLFGYNNPSGAFFYELIKERTVEIWGRNKPEDINANFIYCDLTADLENQMREIQGVLVSFSPIWLLSKYLMKVYNEQPDRLKNLYGIVAVSSSSFMTKRFAFSDYDKTLAEKLDNAHTSLIEICEELDISCQILAPTLVYGSVYCFSDQNISRIVGLMRLMPIILLPESTGYRQPIHASELARIVHIMAEDMIQDKKNSRLRVILALGGDEILSYSQMLARIQSALPVRDAARKCRLISIPNRLFFLLFSLLLPINTRLFEAIMRINTNLSGFTPASSLLGEKEKTFPTQPFLY
jgi:hypothetical protein